MSQYTVDWTTAHLPNFEKLLTPLVGGINLHFLEIGVWEGRTSRWLLDHVLTHSTSVLTAIDCRPQPVFYQNLSRELEQGKMEFFSESSFMQLNQFVMQKRKFDFIYVDGSHLMKNVLEDVVLAFHLLTPGGVMLMDDYPWDDYRYLDSIYDLSSLPTEDRYLGLTPTQAIDAFLLAYQHELEVVFKDYQVAIRKRPQNFEQQFARRQPLPYRF